MCLAVVCVEDGLSQIQSHSIINHYLDYYISHTQLLHSVRYCAFINLASCSSAVSICLLNLSHSLLFLRRSSLVAVLHHVLLHSFLYVTPVQPIQWGFPFSYRGSCACNVCTIHGFPCSQRKFLCKRYTYDARIDYSQLWLRLKIHRCFVTFKSIYATHK